MNYFNIPSKKTEGYKSLADTYVSSRTIQEDVQILGQSTDGTQEDLGTIPDDYYKRLKRLVLAKSAGGTEALIKQLLRLSDWEEVAEIDTIVLDIFLDYDVDVQALNQIVEAKKAGTLGNFESALSKTTEWSLESVLDPKIKKLTDKWKELFGRLTRNVSPKINNVSVGPGEISLTMFTNAVKGQTGDLMVGGVEVEVKAAGGRLGSSDYTKGIMTTPGNKYLNILNPRGQHFSQYENDSIIQSAKTSGNDARVKLEKIQGKINKSLKDQLKDGMLDQDNFDVNMDTFDGAFNQFYSNIESLNNNFKSGTQVMNPVDVANNIATAVETLTSQIGVVFPGVNVITKALTKDLNTVVKKLQSTDEVNNTKTNYNWQTSTQFMFNYDWGLNSRELAEAFVEMRTEQMDQGAVAALINTAEKFFRNKDLQKELLNQTQLSSRSQKSRGQAALQRLQTALMAVSYQSVHGFERLMIINPKQRALKAVNLHFDNGLDAGTQLKEIYSQLKKNPNIVVQNAGVDARNKGIGISLI
jgi:hypothetical protein